MNDAIVGVVDALEKEQEVSFLYKWKIENYFSLPQTENISYCSPSFVFSGSTWCLKVFPYGETGDHSVGCVNIYLKMLHSRTEKHHVKYDIGIQHSDGAVYTSIETEHTVGGDDCVFGVRNLMDAEELRGISDDCPIIFCEFYVVIIIDGQELNISRLPRSFPSNKQKFMNTLCQNMENMYLDQKDCDVILDVSGQEFRAHKNILRARCVVFSNMFEYEMAENLSGRVNIQDVDPNVFKNILIYIYSGEIKELSSDSVFEYYKLSDKFQLAELREACLEFMENNISSANVFIFIQLSEAHGDKKLKDIAKQFLAENIEEVMATEGWAMLKIHNHPITVAILEMSHALQKSQPLQKLLSKRRG